MRVGLVIYGSLDIISGGYLYDRMLVDYLQRQGEQVEIIALPWRRYIYHLSDNLSPMLFKRLAQLDVDVLLQDELNHPSLFWLNRRLKQKYAPDRQTNTPTQPYPPVVSIVHHLHSSEAHPDWQMVLYRWIERRYLASVDGFIFNSQTTRGAVEALVGSANPHIIANPAGDQFQPHIEPEEIFARVNQSGPLRLLFVGNLIPRKGLHTLLDALHQVSENIATLTVVGGSLSDPRYTRALQKKMTLDSLQKQVRFLGSLNQQELATQIRSHHILVVPSNYEGFGIVYLEGMGFGLPAIGTSSGGAAEVITHGQDGFLIVPGDHETLRRYLIEMHGNRQKLAEMSLAARRRYLNHPTWEDSGAIIHSFLKKLTA